MTDLEVVLRRGLRSLADDVAPDAPPVTAIVHRAVRPPRRRRAWVGLAVVGGIVLGGAGAAATGVLPDSLDRLVGREHLIDPASAHVVSTDGTLRLWIADSEDARGITCLYVQRIDKYAHDVSARYSGCVGPSTGRGPSEGLPVDLYAMVTDDGAVAGRAPVGARYVTFTFADGSSMRSEISDRWFVKALPDWAEPVRSVAALDAEGHVLPGPSVIARMGSDLGD